MRKYPALETTKEIEQRLCFLLINKDIKEFHFRLEQGINPNIKIDGTPILQIAAELSYITLSDEHRKMHNLLLKYGANPLQTNSEGKSAIDLLIERNNKEIKRTHIFPSLINHELKLSRAM